MTKTVRFERIVSFDLFVLLLELETHKEFVSSDRFFARGDGLEGWVTREFLVNEEIRAEGERERQTRRQRDRERTEKREREQRQTHREDKQIKRNH